MLLKSDVNLQSSQNVYCKFGFFTKWTMMHGIQTRDAKSIVGTFLARSNRCVKCVCQHIGRRWRRRHDSRGAPYMPKNILLVSRHIFCAFCATCAFLPSYLVCPTYNYFLFVHSSSFFFFPKFQPNLCFFLLQTNL